MFPLRNERSLTQKSLPAQGSRARKRSQHHFWLWKPVEILIGWDKVAAAPCAPLKGPCAHLLDGGLTHSELQSWGSRSKGTRDMVGRTELSSSRVRLKRQLYFRQKCWQKTLFLCWALPTPGMQTQAATIAESPSTWLTPFAMPWWFSEAQPHLTWVPTQAGFSAFFIQMACFISCFRLS